MKDHLTQCARPTRKPLPNISDLPIQRTNSDFIHFRLLAGHLPSLPQKKKAHTAQPTPTHSQAGRGATAVLRNNDDLPIGGTAIEVGGKADWRSERDWDIVYPLAPCASLPTDAISGALTPAPAHQSKPYTVQPQEQVGKRASAALPSPSYTWTPVPNVKLRGVH